MYDQIQAMFSRPEVQKLLQQRVMETLQGPAAPDPMAEGMRAAGSALINTPGNFLSGIAAASGAGASAADKAARTPPPGGKDAIAIINSLINAGKATDLDRYRMNNLDRMAERDRARGAYESGNLALRETLMLLRDALGNRNAANAEARTGIAQQQADTTASNVQSQIATRQGQLEQGDRRLDQGDRRLSATVEHWNQQYDLGVKRLENELKRANQSKADPDTVYNTSWRIIQDMEKSLPDPELVSEEVYNAAANKLEALKQQFISGMSPDQQRRFGVSEAKNAGTAGTVSGSGTGGPPKGYVDPKTGLRFLGGDWRDKNNWVK